MAGLKVQPKEGKTDCSVLVGKPEGPDRLEYLSVDGRIILKYTVKEQDLRVLHFVDRASRNDSW